MKLTPARARLFTLRHLRSDLLPWAIALSVGIDYFDNTIFSFFTSYIAGGINASPDELVWSSTAYATASVLGIVQQQWLIERLGFRRYLSGCLLMFAAGSLAASLSESSLSLAMARGFQGYFIGPMLGTCRIMLQTGFTPKDRAGATRIFLIMILLGSALAPMAGGYLVAHGDPRVFAARVAPSLDGLEDRQRSFVGECVADIDDEQCRPFAEAGGIGIAGLREYRFVAFGEKRVPQSFLHGEVLLKNRFDSTR